MLAIEARPHLCRNFCCLVACLLWSRSRLGLNVRYRGIPPRPHYLNPCPPLLGVQLESRGPLSAGNGSFCAQETIEVKLELDAWAGLQPDLGILKRCASAARPTVVIKLVMVCVDFSQSAPGRRPGDPQWRTYEA